MMEQPRVRDNRSPEDREKFTSKILPPYLRKTKSIEELLPWLYLKGISTGDFNEALQSLLGTECPGLSASTITRLIGQWQEEYKDWSKRSLEDKRYVYLWADGVYFNIRLEEDRQCILVLMGATEDGQKELLAIVDGYRESEQSWTELLLGRIHHDPFKALLVVGQRISELNLVAFGFKDRCGRKRAFPVPMQTRGGYLFKVERELLFGSL